MERARLRSGRTDRGGSRLGATAMRPCAAALEAGRGAREMGRRVPGHGVLPAVPRDAVRGGHGAPAQREAAEGEVRGEGFLDGAGGKAGGAAV